MYVRHRHRRSSFGSEPSPKRFSLGRIIGLVLVVLVMWWAWKTVSGWFGGNLKLQETATLSTENRGIVNVTLQNEGDRTAVDGMALGTGDKVSTGPTAHATLRFRDGTWVRLDNRTTVSITQSTNGEKGGLVLSVPEGQIWAVVPHTTSGSTFASRQVHMAKLKYELPMNAQALLGQQQVVVLSADGEGVTVSGASSDDFTIGEGQLWQGPTSGSISGDPLSYRSAIVSNRDLPAFFIESSNLTGNTRLPATNSGTLAVTTDILSVSTPPSGYILTDATLKVRGATSAAVAKVFVNGYEAQLDPTKRTFTQEISPPDGLAEFDVVVQAFDRSGAILADIRRTVKRQIVTSTGPAAPTITFPVAQNGSFSTKDEELVIRGTSSKDAQSVFVNDYKLQLFDPAKGTWSYLASTRLGNMKKGENVFEVFVVDTEGRRSQPAKITIIQGEAASSTTSSTSSKSSSLTPLPNNAALEPGSLSVTGPSAGLTHTETGTGFLLEGRTSAKTSTISVNGYSLQLYKPGKTTWNYIAAAEFGNLKAGSNTYKVVARNSENQILDSLTYTVSYEPK